MPEHTATNSYRSLFISDLHLGSMHCDAKKLREFLTTNAADTMFLVGDIFDLWSMRAGAKWPAEHSEIVRCLIAKMASGTRLILIPGNHDEALLSFAKLCLPGLEVHREFEVETASGNRLLIVHGHEQDTFFGRTNVVVRGACAVAQWVGGLAMALGLTGRAASAREATPTAGSKRGMRLTQGYLAWFEQTLVAEAHRRNVDGVVCGHSHAPVNRLLNGKHYLNCGDWVRNCTAIAETWSGELQLLRWVPAQRSQEYSGAVRRPMVGAMPGLATARAP